MSYPESTSSFVRQMSVNPLTRAAYRVTTASNQPVRRGLPVVAPNSPPLARRSSPTWSVSSVGKGPSPTRVVYALATPTTRSIRVGPTPVPVSAPPAVGFDEVT